VKSETPLILNLGSEWRSGVNFTLQSLYPRERTRFCIEWWGLVGSKCGLDGMETRKILCTCRNSQPGWSRQPSSHCTGLPVSINFRKIAKSDY